jgi:hypothetical protein
MIEGASEAYVFPYGLPLSRSFRHAPGHLDTDLCSR